MNPFYILILFIAPFMGTIITGFFDLLIDNDVAPLLPQMNGYTFGQALVALAATFLVLQQPTQPAGFGAFIVFVALIFVLVLSAWIDKHQKDITYERISEVLDDKAKIQWKNVDDSIFIKEISRWLLRVDFIPGSPVEKVTNSRKKRRQKLVALINGHFAVTSQLTEKDFEIPEETRVRWRNIQLGITVFSLIFYGASIIALINTQA